MLCNYCLRCYNIQVGLPVQEQNTLLFCNNTNNIVLCLVYNIVHYGTYFNWHCLFMYHCWFCKYCVYCLQYCIICTILNNFVCLQSKQNFEQFAKYIEKYCFDYCCFPWRRTQPGVLAAHTTRGIIFQCQKILFVLWFTFSFWCLHIVSIVILLCTVFITCIVIIVCIVHDFVLLVQKSTILHQCFKHK